MQNGRRRTSGIPPDYRLLGRRTVKLTEDQITLLRGAVNEFSTDLREHRQETKEQLTAVNLRIDGMEQKFDQRFENVDGLLRQVLAVVSPEVARQGVATPVS
jgi:hypothetical protein